MTAIAFPLSLTLAYAGILLICLGMQRHWKQLAHPRLPAQLRPACALLGAASLALAVYTCSFIWHPGMAWVAWFGMISLAGLALLLLLPYSTRMALGLPVAGAALCGVAAVWL
jgi:predicted exporter